MRRLSLALHRDEALKATRVTIGKDKLVYLLIGDKKLTYEKGKSRIVYIGTTKNGVARIAQSVAVHADEILGLRGVRTFHARIITCRPRRRVATWKKLERALLVTFRNKFGSVPKGNHQGKRMKVRDEFRYFSQRAVNNMIDELS